MFTSPRACTLRTPASSSLTLWLGLFTGARVARGASRCCRLDHLLDAIVVGVRFGEGFHLMFMWGSALESEYPPELVVRVTRPLEPWLAMRHH